MNVVPPEPWMVHSRQLWRRMRLGSSALRKSYVCQTSPANCYFHVLEVQDIFMAKVTRLSDQLRELIESSGMSRYRICKEIGLPESTMSQFMAGHCGLALATVDRLGELLRLRIVADRAAGKSKER
jgi:hypothetical protein